MRSFVIASSIAAALALAGAAAYAELALDIRAPRSELTVTGALTMNVSYSLVAANKRIDELKQHYGEGAEIYMSFSGGKITVELNAKVVDEDRVNPRFADVLGL